MAAPKHTLLVAIGVFLLITGLFLGLQYAFQYHHTLQQLLLSLGSAVAGAASLLAGLSASLKLVDHLGKPASKQITGEASPVDKLSLFKINTPSEGDSFLAGSVIQAGGRHSLPAGALVWTVLKDSYGNLYLQNPPLRFISETEWQADNIHLGTEINAILFVQVTGDGHAYFRQKVRRREWGAFEDLPPGSKIIGSVSIKTN